MRLRRPTGRAGWPTWARSRQSGVVQNGHGLHPPMTGTTLRVRGDKRQVQDGPFADTKEQLGGYFVIDVADLDTALEWAARAPCASTGGVEVRPVFTTPDDVTGPAVHEARAAAEKAARQSYGRLVAILSARTRDIAASEDALADAFARALERWPVDGVPDAARSLAAERRAEPHPRRLAPQPRAGRGRADAAARWPTKSAPTPAGGDAVPDERLRLLFVCAHPAIDAAARAPLMLQTVLGLDAARMAGAFLSAPATLGQRLVRAKARIRAAGIPFEFPRASDLPQRLQDVLDGIYAAYGTGWDEVDGADATQRGLTAEAIDLCRILCGLMPDEPEPLGLLALMLFCESRAAARRGDGGAYVPLDEQDIAALEPRRCATRPSRRCSMPRPSSAVGAYQIEAAIQSAHCARRLGAQVPAARPGGALRRLARTAPEHRRAGQPRLRGGRRPMARPRACMQLDAFAPAEVANYQPYWAARAHLLGRTGEAAEARQAYARAARPQHQPGGARLSGRGVGSGSDTPARIAQNRAACVPCSHLLLAGAAPPPVAQRGGGRRRDAGRGAGVFGAADQRLGARRVLQRGALGQRPARPRTARRARQLRRSRVRAGGAASAGDAGQPGAGAAEPGAGRRAPRCRCAWSASMRWCCRPSRRR